jgi:selenoprotein W-related protein
VTATLIEGGGGVFDVRVDGEMMYSKHQTGEFPNEDALVGDLRQRAGNSGK